MSKKHIPDWYEAGLSNIWQPYAQAKIAPPPLPVSHTNGCEIILNDGTKLIDGISSWWSACHGHNHPKLLAAAHQQLDIMPHVMFAGLAHQPAYHLATRLAQLTGLERVFFADSGSVAVEVALKIALQYQLNIGKPHKQHFISLENAYHGDTFGAMGVSDAVNGMHAAYLPNIIAHHSLKLPQNATELSYFMAELERRSETTAALIIEPLVQGAGGMLFYESELLHKIATKCKQLDILLIADEIMTGFGRLGTMFACEQAGVIPDLMCVGKGLTGGMISLAATLAQEYIFSAFYSDDVSKALMHGPTFMANPLACAIANASLDLFTNEPRLKQVQHIESYLRAGLSELATHPKVHELRFKGALAVVQMSQDSGFNPFAMRLELLKYGVWLRPYRNIIYIMPPFTISDAQLDILINAVKGVIFS
jgi:adenosylmethionine---8-amino-7-oxononanoate aminotransferase